LVEDWREQWADHQNRALEAAGHEARVDHRTLEAQGVDRDPTRHMGKEASAMERDGIATRIGDENREATRQDAELDRLRGELAQVEAEVKRQSPTRSKPQEPGKKGLRYVEWYAMQPEPPEQDKPPSFPTARRDEMSAFHATITQELLAIPPPSQEEREAENIRRWCDPFYSFVDTVQEKARDYWDRVSGYWQRTTGKEPGQEPERDPFGR
jgi:hypothetical protein